MRAFMCWLLFDAANAINVNQCSDCNYTVNVSAVISGGSFSTVEAE